MGIWLQDFQGGLKPKAGQRAQGAGHRGQSSGHRAQSAGPNIVPGVFYSAVLRLVSCVLCLASSSMSRHFKFLIPEHFHVLFGIFVDSVSDTE